jgi:hypothetical protein
MNTKVAVFGGGSPMESRSDFQRGKASSRNNPDTLVGNALI